MFYNIKIIYNNSIGEDCVVAETQTIHSFITAYIKLHHLPVVDPEPIAYYLLYVRPDGPSIRLTPHQTFGHLNLAAHGTILELRADRAGGSVGTKDAGLAPKAAPVASVAAAPPPTPRPTTIGDNVAPAPTAYSPNNTTVKLAGAMLNCEIAFSNSKRIPVSRSGLQITREFVASHLPIVSSLLRSIISTDSPITYVSRKCHCEIYYDSDINRWLLRAVQAVFIGDRVYNRGQLFQIPISQTIVRLGRKGIEMTIYHTADERSV